VSRVCNSGVVDASVEQWQMKGQDMSQIRTVSEAAQACRHICKQFELAGLIVLLNFTPRLRACQSVAKFWRA
jgi:hypothetical protein